jgi:hypothetical protein
MIAYHASPQHASTLPVRKVLKLTELPSFGSPLCLRRQSPPPADSAPNKADITLLIHHLRNLTPAEYTSLLTERSIPDSYGNIPSRARNRAGLKSRNARLGSKWVHPEEIERFCFQQCAFRFHKIGMHLVEQPAYSRAEPRLLLRNSRYTQWERLENGFGYERKHRRRANTVLGRGRGSYGGKHQRGPCLEAG